MNKLLLLFVMFSSILLSTTYLHALAPEDILIVYNSNIPDSRDVAEYYSDRRDVPGDNLIGIDLGDSEHISREEFDNNIVKMIRPVVEDMVKKGRNPVILLVYGIPLKVIGGDIKDPAYHELISSRVSDLKELITILGVGLDRITGNSSSIMLMDDLESKSIAEVLEKTRRSLVSASKYFYELKESGADIEKKNRISSIMFRITGMAPISKKIMESAKKEGKNPKIILQQNLFANLNAVLEQHIMETHFSGVTPGNLLDMASIVRSSQGVVGELKFWSGVKNTEEKKMASAAVDSELMMILYDSYQLTWWLPNPFYNNYDRFPGIDKFRNKAVMVGRLDAPTPSLAKRMINDAIEVEQKGLKGVFYIDTKGKKGGYDKKLYNLHDALSRNSDMRVVIDKNEKVFPEDCCPDAALYVGWYSIKKYVDSFRWKKGAVGFHIASVEAASLRGKENERWCKRMIEEGVAATVGPVGEPFLSSFPEPGIFFPLLMSGEMTLLEVYLKSIPHISWRQILIGDPLYNPFKADPAIKRPTVQN